MTAELQNELVNLRRDLLVMGAAVEQRVNKIFDAILCQDSERAREVRKADREINAMELDIDGRCMKLLALHNPVAKDLRFILATLRINQDLERMADLAKSIGKRIIDLQGLPTITRPGAIEDMIENCRKMIGDTLKAMADRDADLASRVRTADDAVDESHKAVFRWALEELPRRGDDAQAIIDLISIGRAIERIADLCTNIAEDIMFAVGGAVVRHTPPR